MAVPLAESNIALLGSELATKVRAEAASCEGEWKGAGSKVGIEIWRVEKLRIKRIAVSAAGKFYNGDSYIVLNTYKVQGSDKLYWNAHFWLGTKTSQDEAGVAAYKTVELDDLLKGAPVQYREVSGHESKAFFDCFPKGIVVMDGGVDSGFSQVKPECYQPRLLHVKGTRASIRLTQVPLDRGSLNDGDVFVLDAGLSIIQWNGTKSGVYEKRRANEIVAQIKEDRNGKPKSIVLDGNEKGDDFWGKLKGGFGPVKSAIEGGTDADTKKSHKQLWKLSDASGMMNMTKTAEGKDIKIDQFDENDVFILDDGGVTLFVWIGSRASAEEKSKAFQYANAYIEDKKLPLTTPVSRVLQGSKSSAFEAALKA